MEMVKRLSSHLLKTLIVLVLAMLVLTVAACGATGGSTSTPPAATTTAVPTATATHPAPTSTSSGYAVKVYFSKHPNSDSNPALVYPVNRVSPDLGVATYSIKQLIAGPTAAEATAGYYTPLTGALTGASNCGGPDFKITLNMKGSTPEAGTATLQFCRTTQLAGDLTGAYIKAEINQTLLQFTTITKVVILTSGGSCFDDLSGLNICLH